MDYLDLTKAVSVAIKEVKPKQWPFLLMCIFFGLGLTAIIVMAFNFPKIGKSDGNIYVCLILISLALVYALAGIAILLHAYNAMNKECEARKQELAKVQRDIFKKEYEAIECKLKGESAGVKKITTTCKETTEKDGNTTETTTETQSVEKIAAETDANTDVNTEAQQQ